MPVLTPRRPGLGQSALIDGMRQSIAELISLERDALERHLQRNRKQRRMHLVLGTGGPLLAVVLMMLLAGRRIARMTLGLEHLAEAARQIEASDLESRIDLHDSRETSALASGFNRMAERLQRRDRQAVLLDRLGRTLQSCHSISSASMTLGAMMPLTLF